jgi:pimeloyl-ACP methyl ester carboxylesterase
VSRITRIGLLVAAIAFGLAASAANAKTIWLCNGARAHDLCRPSLTTTLLTNAGAAESVQHIKRTKPRVDCFYVYPTVSDDKRANSDLSIDPEERSIALYQAARYSQVCRVFAPLYRQVTLTQLLKGPATITPAMRAIAYQSALSGWRDYLRHYNKGRPFVLIGHSQGSLILRQLIAREIDKNAKLRRRMLSAIVLGGNVLVKTGKDVGGDFKHIRACHKMTDVSCVIAFSTFDSQPVPPDSLFGRPRGVGGANPPPGTSVLCALPGPRKLQTILPSQPFAPNTTLGVASMLIGYPSFSVHTPWVQFNGAYSGGCSSANNAHVLQIRPNAGAPFLHAVPDATWGLHLVDANIALGNLVQIVSDETRAFFRHHH